MVFSLSLLSLTGDLSLLPLPNMAARLVDDFVFLGFSPASISSCARRASNDFL